MKKPKDLYMDDEAIPRAIAVIGYPPEGYGALGLPFASSVHEPMVSVDSALMSVSEIEELIIWLMKAHDWALQYLDSDKSYIEFKSKSN
jgi:hypothetical protein